MRLLEHQSKILLSGFGLEFTQSIVVDSVEAAREAVVHLAGPAVLKAQVPFGGRGKAGAVLFVENEAKPKMLHGNCWAARYAALQSKRFPSSRD